MSSKAQTGTRHIILFADANDSRQRSSGYEQVADDIRKDGITISVIGLGAASDRDADILDDVAKRGGGRLMFSTGSDGTAEAVRAGDCGHRAVGVHQGADGHARGCRGWAEIAAKAPVWLPAVDGYD